MTCASHQMTAEIFSCPHVTHNDFDTVKKKKYRRLFISFITSQQPPQHFLALKTDYFKLGQIYMAFFQHVIHLTFNFF